MPLRFLLCIFFLLQNRKEPVPVAVAAMVEAVVAAMVAAEEEAAAAVEILEEVDLPD